MNILLKKLGGVLCAALVFSCSPTPVSAFSSRPYAVPCDDPIVFSNYERRECNFSGSPYVTPANREIPVSYIAPKTGDDLRILVDLHAYTAYPIECINSNGALADTLLIKNCAAHYPDQTLFRVQPGNNLPMGWWGLFGGQNSNGFRISESIDSAVQYYLKRIDLSRGIHLRGRSYGATGSLLQSVLMEEYQTLLTVVEVFLPHTLFVKKDDDLLTDDPDGFVDGIDERGHYHRDPAVGFAWDGGMDLSVPANEIPAELVGSVDPALALADVRYQWSQGKGKNIYYRVRGSTSDNLGRVDLDFFRACDMYKVACYGTWDQGAHDLEPGIGHNQELYTCDARDERFDEARIVITDATSNNWGVRGHYNEGFCYTSKQAHWASNNEDGLVIPIKYTKRNISGIAAMPDDTTFTFHAHNTVVPAEVGNQFTYTLNDQTGTVTVTDEGYITIPGLQLSHSTDFSALVINPYVAPTPEDHPWKIVFTQQPLLEGPGPGNSTVADKSNFIHASDVGRINNSIAEADVVVDDLNGNSKVIFDCTTKPRICVAQEARVNPTGDAIVFSVGYGNSLVPVRTYEGSQHTGLMEIDYLTHADLYFYNLKTDQLIKLNLPPGIHRQPVFTDKDTIAFSSNMGDTYPFKNGLPFHSDPARKIWPVKDASQEYGYLPHGKSMQIWKIDIVGTNLENLTPHEQMALSPAVMTNGDILYSCWNAHGNKSHYSANAVGPGTSKNKWWLCRMDGAGGDSTVILNGHKPTHIESRSLLPASITGGEGTTQLKAIRSVAEIFKGKLAISNYYRANHVGSMGIIMAIDYLNPHVEGCGLFRCDGISAAGSGRYSPLSLKALTPYGNDQDLYDNRRYDHDNDPLTRKTIIGKAGYPAPVPNSETEWMFTHSFGLCFDPSPPANTGPNFIVGSVVDGNEITSTRACWKVLAKAKVEVITNPHDSNQVEYIAVDPNYNRFDGQYIAKYSEFYGQAVPDLPPIYDKTASCKLQVNNAKLSDLALPRNYNWQTTLFEACAHQACIVKPEDPSYFKGQMAALTLYSVDMWDITYYGSDKAEFTSIANNMGHKGINLLGSYPLESDGSVQAEVPCNTPFIMVGTNVDGEKVAHDEMLHSLRPGETRSCRGCHEGHSTESAATYANTIQEDFLSTDAFTNGPVSPIDIDLDGVSCATDVLPILTENCAGSCHSKLGQAYTCDDLTWDFRQVSKLFDTPTVTMPLQVGPNAGRPNEMARPYTSKWVAKFAKNSLLYWKCKGERLDGRTDGTYTNDIDFGAVHAQAATDAECKTIAQWIDSGAQR